MTNNGAQEVEQAAVDSNEIIAMRLEKDDDLSWMMIPAFFKRVKRFCQKYDPDTNGDLLCNTIAVDFISEKPNFCCAMISQEGQIVGHTLILAYNLLGKRYAEVMQVEIDKGVVVSRETIGRFTEMFDEWAAMKECDIAQATVIPGAHERRMSIFHKFKPYKMIMRREL